MQGDDRFRRLAAEAGLEFVDLDPQAGRGDPVASAAARLIAPEIARRYQVIAVRADEGSVTVAAARPATPALVRLIERATGRAVRLVVASPAAILRAQRRQQGPPEASRPRRSVLGRRWEIHAMIVASLLTLVGAQIVQLGVFARTYAFLFLEERDALLEAGWRRIRLEHGLAAGAIVLVGGLGLLGGIVGLWVARGFGELHEEHLSVLALTLIGLGVQIVFGSFFLSILPLGARRRGG